MAERKVSKIKWYEKIYDIVEISDAENKAEVLDFISEQMRQLREKTANAREAAAKKKAAGDELRNAVYSVLKFNFQTIDQIVDQIEGEDVTKAKVTARLTQLFKAGLAEKSAVKDDNGKKVMAYRMTEKEIVDETQRTGDTVVTA